MDILIVGAGAVGQVYGRHLARAGHRIAFFVKEKYAGGLAKGMPLHRLGHLGTASEVWRDYTLVTSTAAIGARRWDQVWLAFSSDALYSPLADEVLAQCGDATVVCLQPGPQDGAHVGARLRDPAQMVQGLITFISYQSPLPGRPGPAGIAYFLPPLAPGLFGGRDPARVQAVVQALRAGGMSARVVTDTAAAGNGSEALMIPLVAALETNGWKLGSMPGSEAFARGRAAAKEALAILARDRGTTTWPQQLLLGPLLSRVVLRLAPHVLPLELEPYLEYHFSKVGQQTRDILDAYAALGTKLGMPVGALKDLRARL